MAQGWGTQVFGPAGGTRDVTLTVAAGASQAAPTTSVNWVAVSVLPPGTNNLQRVLRLVVQPNLSANSSRAADIKYAGATLRVSQSLTFDDNILVISYNRNTDLHHLHSVNASSGATTFLRAFTVPRTYDSNGNLTASSWSNFLAIDGYVYIRISNGDFLRYDRNTNEITTLSMASLRNTLAASGLQEQGMFALPPLVNNSIDKRADGSIHIGTNSLVTLEDNGTQKLYASGANGQAIDINLINGSKVLIDGGDVRSLISSGVTSSPSLVTVNQTVSQLQAQLASANAVITGLTSRLTDLTGRLARLESVAPLTPFTASPTVTSWVPILNSASLALSSSLSVAPNEMVSLSLPGINCPTTPAVSVSGIAAETVRVSPGQMDVVLPEQLTSGAVAVTCQGAVIWSHPLTLAKSVPGIFTAGQNGTGQGSIVNENGALNGPSKPSLRGSVVTVYATGLGSYAPASSDGLRRIADTVTATVGGVTAPVSYAGQVPGSTLGLNQVNIQIPPDVLPGSAVPIVITVNGVSTQAGVTLAIE